MRTTFFNILLQDHTHTTKQPIPKPQPITMTAKPHINPRKSIGNYWLGKTVGHGSSGVSVRTVMHNMSCEKKNISVMAKIMNSFETESCLDNIRLPDIEPPQDISELIFNFCTSPVSFKYIPLLL
jgi:hypothetical protein